MRKFNTEAVILKSIKYRDSDKIFTLFSPDQGKFTAIGRGIRKISSKRSGTMDTLNHVQISITSQNNGPKYISEVVLVNSFPKLKDDLGYSVKGFYIVELLHRLIEDEAPNYELFETVIKTLKLLDSKRLNSDMALSYFEISLMRQLGYALRFGECVSCGKEFSDDWNYYRMNLGLGGLVCDDCRNGLLISPKDAQFLNSIEKGKVVKEAVVSKETLNLVRTFIRDILEDNFRTAKVFGSI